MNKLTKITALTIALSCLFIFMTGCSLSGNTGEGFTQSTITLYDEDTSVQYVAKYGEYTAVSVPTKQSYYLEGYYDAQDGGTKYIGSDGKSESKWEKSFPTELYAHWADISELKATVNVFDSNPKDGGTSARRTAIVKLDKELKAILASNPGAKIKVEYTVDLKIGANITPFEVEMYFKGEDDPSAERYSVFTVTPTVGSFTTYSGVKEIDASAFAGGEIYLTLLTSTKTNGALAHSVFYSSNLTLTLSVVN